MMKINECPVYECEYKEEYSKSKTTQNNLVKEINVLNSEMLSYRTELLTRTGKNEEDILIEMSENLKIKSQNEEILLLKSELERMKTTVVVANSSAESQKAKSDKILSNHEMSEKSKFLLLENTRLENDNKIKYTQLGQYINLLEKIKMDLLVSTNKKNEINEEIKQRFELVQIVV